MKYNKQLKYSNHVAFSHFHVYDVNNLGLYNNYSLNLFFANNYYISYITNITKWQNLIVNAFFQY